MASPVFLPPPANRPRSQTTICRPTNRTPRVLTTPRGRARGGGPPPPRSRLYNSAPDLASALQRLEDARADLLEFGALSIVSPAHAGGPSPISDVALRSLEDDDAAVPPSDRSHWVYAVRQIAMEPEEVGRGTALVGGWGLLEGPVTGRGESICLVCHGFLRRRWQALDPLSTAPIPKQNAPEQRERIVALLELSRQHIRRTSQRRDGLLAACATCVDDAAAQERLVAELARVQRSYTITNTGFLLALYGTVMTAQQLAAYAVGSYPYPPSKFALMAVLLEPAGEDEGEGEAGRPGEGGGAAAAALG